MLNCTAGVEVVWEEPAATQDAIVDVQNVGEADWGLVACWPASSIMDPDGGARIQRQPGRAGAGNREE